MFRTLICPSSGACDYIDGLPHRLPCSVIVVLGFAADDVWNYYLSNQPHRDFPNINFKNTSTKEIENIIRSVKANESHGYDGITTKILKISAPFISYPLSYVFNKSMISGIFPSRLKYASIKQIFKNGDKKKCSKL